MRYVIYVPDDGPTQAKAIADCLAYAEHNHPDWRSAGVIVGRWPAVITMAETGLIQVILVAERSHLPPDRIPRIVAVEEELGPPASGNGRPGWRRPRPLV